MAPEECESAGGVVPDSAVPSEGLGVGSGTGPPVGTATGYKVGGNWAEIR